MRFWYYGSESPLLDIIWKKYIQVASLFVSLYIKTYLSKCILAAGLELYIDYVVPKYGCIDLIYWLCVGPSFQVFGGFFYSQEQESHTLSQ